jgi:hypothetical protein
MNIISGLLIARMMAELQSSALVPGGTSKVRGTVVSMYYSKVPGTPVSKRLQSTWGDGGVIALLELLSPWYIHLFGCLGITISLHYLPCSARATSLIAFSYDLNLAALPESY